MAQGRDWWATLLCEGATVLTKSGTNIRGPFCVATKVCASCITVCCFGLVRPKEKQKIIFLYFLLTEADTAYE